MEREDEGEGVIKQDRLCVGVTSGTGRWEKGGGRLEGGSPSVLVLVVAMVAVVVVVKVVVAKVGAV